MNLKFKKSDLYIYSLMIPFLFPRGFSEYSAIYKSIFTAWLYVTMFAVISKILFSIARYKTRYNAFLNIVFLYHIYMLITTLLIRGGLSEGLQKIFAVPALCYLTTYYMKKKPLRFIECVSNILILNFILCLTIFSPVVLPKLFSAEGNMLFIGHVQTASQLGALGILLGTLLIVCSANKKAKGFFLIILTVCIMIESQTITSYICLIILIVCAFIILLFKSPKILLLDSRVYASILFIINIFFIVLLKTNAWRLIIFGINTSFNGRISIWSEAVQKINLQPMFGYGVYGYRLHPYWYAWTNNTNGMIYAHNEILQLMLDGGVVLTILFFALFMSGLSNMKDITNPKIKMISNICIIIYFIIMLPDVPTEYFYFFFMVSILSELKYVEVVVDSKNVYRSGEDHSVLVSRSRL
jgi:O-antigen ligase